MNGLIFVPLAGLLYFLRKEGLNRKIKTYVKQKNGRYLSEYQPSLYKSIYVVKYEDEQKNIRRVRVNHKFFGIVFTDDELVDG